ncbi:glycosyl hydrolase [Nannochloropsis oceanica]
MRSAFSLLALGTTFVLTAAQPMVTLTSIKAVDVARENKDQWSLKGYVDDPTGTYVPLVDDIGLNVRLVDSNNVNISAVNFAPSECNPLLNDKGTVCKVTGARYTLRKINKLPKSAMISAQKKHNKTSSESFYYKLSGVFRRQEFTATVATPLTVIFAAGNVGTLAVTNTDCTEKDGAKSTRYLCTPGAPTPAPTGGGKP